MPVALMGVGALALAGCSGGSGHEDDGVLTVVTSTSVYADVVEQIVNDADSAGGEGITVKAVIDSPAQDPHSYEATPQDRLTVQDADLIVLNGGGYDAFMEELAAETDVPVVNAVDVSGLDGADSADSDHDHSHDASGAATAADDDSGQDSHDGHDHGSFNEHVWYDPATMGKVGEAVAHELGSMDANRAQLFTDNAGEFTRETDQLRQQVAELKLEGDYVATEPVADYLLEAAGLHNVTPTAFTVAVEDGTDAAPLVYDQVRSLLESDTALLVYNEQTSTGQSQDLRTVAERADVPVLAVSETLPDGQSYVQWMEQNIQDVQSIEGLGHTTESHDH